MFFIHSTKIFIEITDNLGTCILNVLYMKIIILYGVSKFHSDLSRYWYSFINEITTSYLLDSEA